jgi:hypothetical protein
VLYVFLFLLLASLYVGQRVYFQRLAVSLGAREQSIQSMQDAVQSLRAERDRLTSPAVLGPRAEQLGLRPAAVTQLARVPLTLPSPVPELDRSERGFTGALARVWRWLDGPVIQKQEVQAAP